jgi:hypothetical protein
MRRNVAQISNLLYRRFPIGRLHAHSTRIPDATSAGWKHCDTADWKSALRTGRLGIRRALSAVVCLRRSWYVDSMSAGTATAEKRWKYEDYLRLDDEHRYEVIEGQLIMAPAPDTSHQRSVRDLLFVITHFIREKKLGEVFVAPIEVVLDSKNVVQPDLVFVATEHSKIVERRGIMGTPEAGLCLVLHGKRGRQGPIPAPFRPGIRGRGGVLGG